MKFSFVTTGNTASLLLGEKPVALNLSKTDLFKLFTMTEFAIEEVETFERNKKFEKLLKAAPKGPKGWEFVEGTDVRIQTIPRFESCLSE